MGLVIHVVNHTAQARSIRMTNADRDDLCAEVFLAFLENEFSILRNFRGQSSLATYLTVVSRRIVVRQILSRQSRPIANGASGQAQAASVDPSPSVEDRIGNQEEVARLLGGLQGTEAQVVRMFHLEGKNYHEISDSVGMPENSIGPILSRARNKMRRAGVS
jgi:RNA polymerase sigma-70 factor (ECF subfamily)